MELGVVPTFIVEALDAARCGVVIRARLPDRAGMPGVLERNATKRFLRRVYEEQLRFLEREVTRGRSDRIDQRRAASTPGSQHRHAAGGASRSPRIPSLTVSPFVEVS